MSVPEMCSGQTASPPQTDNLHSLDTATVPIAAVDIAHPVIIVHSDNTRIESRPTADGTDVGIYSGGFYAYQRSDLGAEGAGDEFLLELRGENAVVFYNQKRMFDGDPNIGGVYLEGDVLLQARHHQITTDRLYYDFQRQTALVIDGTLQLHMPRYRQSVYVRAKEIRQLGEAHFAVTDVQMSTDEFYQPHTWAGIKALDIKQDANDPNLIQYDMHDFTVNLGPLPLFWWPRMKGQTASPETALQAIHMGDSSDNGFSVETEWPLTRLLNLPEVKGVEPTLKLDNYSKRGPGAGLDVDYIRENHYGRLRGYLLGDDGKDRLSRFPARKDVEPMRDLRGRLRWQHRQYLSHDWQATAEASWISDPDYLESWEKDEFNGDKEQETLLYLKKQRDNWAFDVLNKWQLNDYGPTITELPTGGFHLAGQDLFEHFTYQQNTTLSHMQERVDDRKVPGFSGTYEPSVLPPTIDGDHFAYGVSRHELALPLHGGGFHLAPTAIGTAVFDDSQTGAPTQNSFHQGAFGFRASTQYWHINRSVRSRLWNLDQIRHIVIPEVSMFWVQSNQRNTREQDLVNLALRQRWQTKRGLPGEKHSVDFLRLDTAVTLVSNDVDNVDIPNTFFFACPEPQFMKPAFVNDDLANLGLARREQVNQTLSDFAYSNLEWRISDTTLFQSSANYNIHDAILSQIAGTVAVQRSPRTSYFAGMRYLNDGNVSHDKVNQIFETVDGKFVHGGMTYKINRKYTVAFSHQFDLENDQTAYSQVGVIRKFPRWYGAFTVEFNSFRDSYSVGITFWPEGFGGAALGSRRYQHVPADSAY